jgi:hypothetical protein
MIIIKCAICGKEIINPKMLQVTCSKECRFAYQPIWRATYRIENLAHIKKFREKYNKTEACKKSQREWRLNNKEKIRMNAKVANKKFRDGLTPEQKEEWKKRQREYYANLSRERKDIINIRQRKYYANWPIEKKEAYRKKVRERYWRLKNDKN